MTNIRDLKLNIIDVLMQTDDMQTLVATYQTLIKPLKQKEKLPQPVTQDKQKEIPTTEIRSGVSLEQIIKEQNYKPVPYEEFRETADKLTLNEPIEELLEMLKK